MDTDKIVEKIIKWLSDPKGREMFKTIVYVVLPLFLLLAFRRAGRRRPAEKSSTAIEPKIRPASYDSPSTIESLNCEKYSVVKTVSWQEPRESSIDPLHPRKHGLQNPPSEMRKKCSRKSFSSCSRAGNKKSTSGPPHCLWQEIHHKHRRPTLTM
jgi:hypothetical protein